MNLEALYAKLPDFIKYNNFILNFFLKIPKHLEKWNKKSDIVKSQNHLFELIFLNSKFEVTGMLRDIQLLYLELLRFVHNVCIKYGIDYWLVDGTLLGAVRHGGFIPWDDDIDLAIMRKDYEKLIEVLPKEIKKHDYLYGECGLTLLKDNHENYFKDFKSVYDYQGDTELLDPARFTFLQIAWLKPYVKIDFFPKDYIREDMLETFNRNYLSTKYKFNQDVKNGKKSFDEELKIKSKEVGFTRDEDKYLNDALDTLQLFPICINETERIFPLSTIEFEDYEFKCPKDADYCLKAAFGNSYMHLPEVIETHNITPFIESQFASKKEMEDKFKKSIEYLRQVNDNFY